MREWWNKLRSLGNGRDEIGADLAEEVESHLQMEAERFREQGMTPEAARSAARRRFGNTTQVAEQAHDAWQFAVLESLARDIRYGFRAMRRAPAFSLVVILTFGLGVGINAAIFSVVNAVLLKPLPYPASERIVMLSEANGKVDMSVTWGNFHYWRDGNHSFEAMAGFQFFERTLTGRGDPITARELRVTAAYFGLLGLHPLMGRVLGEADDLPDAPATLVLSHRFWASKFAGDPRIVGQTVTLNGTPFEVVGVAAPLWTPWRVDYYVSLGRIAGTPANRTQHGSIRALARLKPRITLAAARSDLDGIMRHLDEIDPGSEKGHRSFGTFLTESSIGGMRTTMMVLMGAALLILLIACANVASLLVARNTARTAELALRKAIGAGHFRLVRQLLTENVVIAVAGGAAGMLFAYCGLQGLLALAPTTIPRLADTRIDGQVLLFASAITLAAGLLAALAPVLLAGRIDLSSALKEGARTAGSGKRRQSLRSGLIVAQVAITMVLAFASGLLLRSLAAAQSSNPGFRADHLLTFTLDLPPKTYSSPAAVNQFFTSLTANLRSLPGVVDARAVHCPPPAGDCGDWFYSVPGRAVPARDQVPIAFLNVADPGYFKMMGIPLQQGREFTAEERAHGAAVIVINQTLARAWWPNEPAVGHQIKFGGPYQDGDLLEIIGVAGDVRQSGLDTTPDQEIFLTTAGDLENSKAILIRTAGDPGKLIPAARAQVAALDRNLPIQRPASMEATLAARLDRRRFSALLLALFAGLAMLLAAVGIYGLLNYWVTSREGEIAVRLALGASPTRILRWTSLQAMRLALGGVVLGALGAWASARLLKDMVFGIPAHNPATLGAAIVAVMALAFVATAIPSWRAARVDAARRLHQG